MLKRIENLITKIEPPNWVLIILGFTFLLRIPSLFEPYYYGDEMIYITLGNAVRKGLTLYSQIHDNKPPLIYIFAAFAGNLFWFKALLMFWMLATIIVFWHLANELFQKNILAQKISVAIFAVLTTIPLLEGQIVNAELFLIGPTILAVTLLLKSPVRKNLFIAGLLFSLAVLFKVPAIFDVPVIILFWLIATKDVKDLPKLFQRSFFIFLGLITPILVTLIFFALHNAAGDFIKAALLQNIGYVSSWSGAAAGNTSFVIKHGPLLIRAGFVLVSLIILRIFARKLSRTFIIACIWLLTSLFAATLSERPYPHYLVQVIPAITILITIFIASSKKEQVFTVFPLTLAFLVPVYFKFWYYPTLPYYTNFVNLIVKQDKWQFFNSFDKNTRENYDIATIVTNTTETKDKIFVWGEEAPTIYALTKRLPSIKYTANYHITDFSSTDEVALELENNPPVMIVFLPDSPHYTKLDKILSKKYILLKNSPSRSQIWRLKETLLK